MRFLVLTVAVLLVVGPLARAEVYIDKTSVLWVHFPDKWAVNESRKDATSTSPDGSVTVLATSFKGCKDATQALMKLDQDDAMGGQVKTIRVIGDPKKGKVHDLEQTLFSGTVVLSNVKTNFTASVVPNRGAYLVVIALGGKDSLAQNEKDLAKIFASIDNKPPQ